MIENIGAYSQFDYDRGYRQGKAESGKEHEELCKVCIHKVSKADIDSLQESARENAIDECIKIVDKYDSVIANYLREELKEQKRR